MSIPKFVAINPHVTFLPFAELECYGVSDLSVVGALRSFKRDHLAGVSQHLGVQPGGTIEVQVWTTRAVCSDFLHWEFAGKKATFNLVWEG